MKIFFNASFYKNENVKAVGVENGKIVDLFYNLPKIKTAEYINLKGSYVYPGFIDTHTHSFEGGLYSSGANLEKVSNIDETLEILSQTSPIGNMIFAFHFDENKISEKRFPTLEEMDKLFPDKPAILRRVDGHSCVINSFAAKLIDWIEPLPHNFNGILRKRWNDTAANWFHKNLDEEGIIKAYQTASEIGKRNGYTTIHTMIGNGAEDPEHYLLIKNNLNLFDVEFILYPQITSVKTALNLGSKRIGGCILADGSFGSHTAALKQPYADQPQNSGILYHTTNFWKDMITKAHQNNLQVGIHAIGDRAISQILDIYHHLQMTSPKDLRHEIIHNELTDDKMLNKMKEANISAVMQPMFDRLWGGKNGLYEKVLGKERTERTNRLHSIMQRNILLTGGSDWYITELNPLKGINAATKIHNQTERLSKEEAIKIYTENAAFLSFDENRLGKIDMGFQADFTCLKNNILDTDEIDKIKINFVIKRGEIIYSPL